MFYNGLQLLKPVTLRLPV